MLETAPFIQPSELMTYAGFSGTAGMYRARETVPVAKIIAAPAIAHWGDIKDHRRTNEYIVKMLQAALREFFNGLLIIRTATFLLYNVCSCKTFGWAVLAKWHPKCLKKDRF